MPAKRKTADEAKDQSEGRLIKYMGASDFRVLEPGETLLGQLAEPLPVRLEWGVDDHHLLKTADYPDVAEAFWDVLLEFDDFLDVTGMERIPQNVYDSIYRPLPQKQMGNLVDPEMLQAGDDDDHEPVQSSVDGTDGGPTTV
jgi:hypothetical protein